MALIPAQKIKHDNNRVIWLWEAVGTGDTCEPANAYSFDDPTLYVFGTMSTGTVELHVTPEVITTPTLFSPCTSSGVAISLDTANTNKVVDQCGEAFKPVASAGDGMSDVDIYLVIR